MVMAALVAQSNATGPNIAVLGGHIPELSARQTTQEGDKKTFGNLFCGLLGWGCEGQDSQSQSWLSWFDGWSLSGQQQPYGKGPSPPSGSDPWSPPPKAPQGLSPIVPATSNSQPGTGQIPITGAFGPIVL